MEEQKHVMQPQEIILLPPTDESLPSFHVREDLLSPFLDHLAKSGIKIAEPPEPQGESKPEAVSVVEVDVQENTPISRLQEVLDEFLKRHGLPESAQKS